MPSAAFTAIVAVNTEWRQWGGKPYCPNIFKNSSYSTFFMKTKLKQQNMQSTTEMQRHGNSLITHTHIYIYKLTDRHLYNNLDIVKYLFTSTALLYKQRC